MSPLRERVGAITAATLCLTACTTAPEAYDHAAASFGLERSEVTGEGFRHAVYRAAADESRALPLHVYLEGDGTPYVRPGLAAADPTPRDPLAIRLLASDPAPAVLLGRPCYHGVGNAAGCSEDWWTTARYSESVVSSMAAALRKLAPGHRPLVLIGFSGGGTLAVLLSRRLPQVVAVVTLAGNLDIDGWTDAHGYARLTQSLNPADMPTAPVRLVQLHYAGTEDREVPFWIAQRAARRIGGEFYLLDGIAHHDGWERHWPAILATLQSRLDRRPTRDPGRKAERSE